MSTTAATVRQGHYEFVPSRFVGKSGALFLDLRFRPDPVTKPTKEKTQGSGSR